MFERLQKIIKNRKDTRFGVKRWIYGKTTSAKIDLSTFRFADAVIVSAFKLLMTGFKNTEFFDEGKQDSLLFESFHFLFRNRFAEILASLYDEGQVGFNVVDGKLEIAQRLIEAEYVIESPTYSIVGKSDARTAKDVLKYIDNILNASNTSITKLGFLALLSPENFDDMPTNLTDAEVKEYENELAKEYGVLESQSPIKVLKRKMNLQTIGLGGANLQVDARLQSAVKLFCGQMEVPYELMPAAIIGNPNQTGVYQEQALVRLYNTIEAYVEIYKKLGERVGLKTSYEIRTKPKEDLKTKWEAVGKMVEVVRVAFESGALSVDEMKQIIRDEII